MLKPKATNNITTTCLQTHATMNVIGATSTKRSIDFLITFLYCVTKIRSIKSTRI